MTPVEIRRAIGQSNSNECYEIVYLINNGKLEEASARIQNLFTCDAETAMAASRIFESELKKSKAAAASAD